MRAVMLTAAAARQEMARRCELDKAAAAKLLAEQGLQWFLQKEQSVEQWLRTQLPQHERAAG
jgi:hypothetical protein